MEISENLNLKLKKLKSFLEGKKVIVAFSGGVDSSLLAFLANKYAKNTLLITERSILYPEEEIREASQFANNYGIEHKIIERDPLEDKEFQCNSSNRCYICKTGLYSDILKIKNSKKFDVILDGSNVDDLSDYRPGMQALKELNIFTPYIDYNINKTEIRQISKLFDLDVQSKPSMACFSSRIPYGQIINEKKLDMIREAERFLRNSFELRQLRVRLHEENLARIEFLPNDLANVLTAKNLELIKSKLKELGFTYITIDIEGFRSGSMNEVLDLNN
ncbi:MAG: ATP-dependent sacrificial sulfur transferase LarE [Candidatus Lokiarchaeota archaeon]|nr:ATP-dependent sacrificial sulfur transferase LarE [Candidatus Lokiarchaeota archaeon]